ncbi:MAG: hypothetical protein IK089_05770 [Oxalobacter sp.]|nr:hypothetical protein [Oxalobacter sp.]
MKKLMFGMAAALALCGMADIESSNTVGYQTKDAVEKGKFYILGGQFDAVAGGRAINEIFAPITGVDYDEDNVFKNVASQIQVPSGAGYKTYFFLNDGWYDDGTDEGAVKAGWCDGAGNITDDELVEGVAFWFKNKVDANGSALTQMGQVPADATIDVDCPDAFALRANPYPTAFALNGDKVITSGAAEVFYDDDNAFKKTAPQIQLPSGEGYQTFFYLADGWYDDGTAEGATKAGWCDGAGNITDVVIPASQGFWTKGVGGAFVLKFSL